jgi:hypothetical protein
MQQLNISKKETECEENGRHSLPQWLGIVIISAVIKLLDRDIQNSGFVFVIRFIVNYVGA